MIRLFTALDIPESIKMQLQGMGGSIPGAKPVPKEQFHLTLKFIGEVEGRVLLDIEQALGNIKGSGNVGKLDLAPFNIRLKGVGVFPPRGAPRVLWVGIEEDGKLSTLRKAIENELAANGIARSKQKFTPHISVARLKKSPVARLQDYLAGNSFFETAWFPVNSFSLYSSKLTPKGAVHNCQRTYFMSTAPAQPK